MKNGPAVWLDIQFARNVLRMLKDVECGRKISPRRLEDLKEDIAILDDAIFEARVSDKENA